MRHEIGMRREIGVRQKWGVGTVRRGLKPHGW
jgi:hypothetical protein